MNWRRILKSPWTILVMMFTVLAGLNASLSHSEIDISPITVSSSSPIGLDAAMVPGDVAVTEVMQLSQTLIRPLFSPTRREFTPESKPLELTETQPAIATQDADPIAPPTIAFLGTRIIGQERRALVQLEGAERADWLSIGAQVSDWIIADIGDTNLHLSRRDQSTSYELFGSEGNKQSDAAQFSATSSP